MKAEWDENQKRFIPSEDDDYREQQNHAADMVAIIILIITIACFAHWFGKRIAANPETIIKAKPEQQCTPRHQ